VSAARARRRLMAHERYRRRALQLTGQYHLMDGAHLRAFERALRWNARPWLVRTPPWSRRWHG
jgi:hypothetical protein